MLWLLKMFSQMINVGYADRGNMGREKMKWKTVSRIMPILLSISLLTLAFSIQSVKAEPTSSIEYVEGFNIDEPLDASLYYDADWFGLAYTPTVSYNIKKVELIAGGGSGNFIIQLRPDSGGMPSDTILRETSFTQADTVSWQGAEFTESCPLTADTTYWIVFKPVFYSQASIAKSGTPITHVWDYGGDGWDGTGSSNLWMAKFYREVAIPSISISVDIHPQALNLKSKGRWIAAYIELSKGHSVNDVDVSSIRLNGTILVDPVAPTQIGDHDGNGIPYLMVKFSRTDMISFTIGKIEIEERFLLVTLTITGNLNDGTPFEGSETIKVIA